MGSFKLTSAGRVTLGVGLPCLRKRVTLVGGATFIYVNSLSRLTGTTFQTNACAIKHLVQPLLKQVTVLSKFIM